MDTRVCAKSVKSHIVNGIENRRKLENLQEENNTKNIFGFAGNITTYPPILTK
jgi:hypothetical protein